ncbi:Sec-independent protein translocase protein TatB [uncultured Roseovarius sp.]|uniref:Sec-independent protein translocase protein TatB n=1 Tax=uncultured Roseovarius sp. TaxID=293344 RepID=UPI0026110722|nr:Sec-independent protein translocase protein TatB [uncultured Roseovarius sp.]
MLDLGWTELLLIGIVALIVVGPKDLPGMFQAVGKFVGKAKGMAREFSRAMNDAADHSGVNEIQKTFKAASNPMKSAMDEVKKTTENATRDLTTADVPPLSEERQAQADKIREKAGEMATARKTAEAEAEAKAAAEAQATETKTPETKTKDAPQSKASKAKTKSGKTTKAKAKSTKAAAAKVEDKA